MAAARKEGQHPTENRRKKRLEELSLSPGIQRERETILNALRPLTELLSTVVGPNVEVVLHDLTKPEASIVAIANGYISRRSVGDSILSGPRQDKGFASAKLKLTARGQPFHSIIDDYNTVTAAGQHLHSTTALYRDSEGEPFAALCINVDLTIVEMTHAWLGRMLNPKREQQTPRQPNESPQVDVLIEEIISDAVAKFGKPVPLMNKEEKIHAVEVMLERGLFMVRGGVERAATALHVTRFTVYNYLEALRSHNEATGPSSTTIDGVSKTPAPRITKPRPSQKPIRPKK